MELSTDHLALSDLYHGGNDMPDRMTLAEQLREKLAFDELKAHDHAEAFLRYADPSKYTTYMEAQRWYSYQQDKIHEQLLKCVEALEYSNQVLQDKIDMMVPTNFGKVNTKGILQLTLEMVVKQQTKALSGLRALVEGES